MDPTSISLAIRAVKRQGDGKAAPVKIRGLLWRSGLLNVAIVVTALPVMAYAGGPTAVQPALMVMGGSA